MDGKKTLFVKRTFTRYVMIICCTDTRSVICIVVVHNIPGKDLNY